MTEFEDRLRAAMKSSVAAEHPSGNLVARVRRRHRRHLARAGVVWTAAAVAVAEPYFRFLPGFDGTGEYTPRDGQAGATFGGCPAQSSRYGKGFTEFSIGVVVAGPRCVTLAVRTTQDRPPVRTTLRFGRCVS